MDFVELAELRKAEQKICLYCIGPFGAEDGYLFLNNMLMQKENLCYLCPEAMGTDVTVPDTLVQVDRAYLSKHSDSIVCVVMGLDEQGAARKRLEEENIKTYGLNRDDMFRLCSQIAQTGDTLLTSALQGFWKQRKYKVQIETSSFCNARCTFCTNASLKREKNIMTQAVFEKIIERIQQEKLNIASFILHLNGEPLMDPALFSRVKRLKGEFPEAKVRFTSNFALATGETIDQIFESGLDEIICSLNAVDPVRYREIMGLEYDRTVDNIERLIEGKKTRRSPLSITLSIVASQEEEDEVEKFKARWNGVNVRVMKLGKWIDQEQPHSVYARDRSGICPAPYTKLHILSNGDYSFCDFDAEGIVGCNVMDTSIRDAWNARVFQDTRAWQLCHGRTNPECVNCSF